MRLLEACESLVGQQKVHILCRAPIAVLPQGQRADDGMRDAVRTKCITDAQQGLLGVGFTHEKSTGVGDRLHELGLCSRIEEVRHFLTMALSRGRRNGLLAQGNAARTQSTRTSAASLLTGSSVRASTSSTNT
jgi:hypothetical protein